MGAQRLQCSRKFFVNLLFALSKLYFKIASLRKLLSLGRLAMQRNLYTDTYEIDNMVRIYMQIIQNKIFV